MNDRNRADFAQLMADVMGFYRQSVSDFALGVWWQACENFEFEQVTKAFSAHLMDPDRGQFVPKPADLVRVLHGTQVDRSLVAWGKVLDAMQRVGAYQSVAFDDGAIHAAIVDMGGWATVCRGEMDALPFTQKRFTDLHRAYSLRPDAPYPARLAGDHEASNALRNFAVVPPVLIGDPEKAKQVQLAGVMGSKTKITAQGTVDATRIGVDK